MQMLDEVIELGERGIALLCVEGEPYTGMKLRDARGNIHEAAAVSEQDGLFIIYLPKGDAAYFGRLFRDIRIQADAFEEVE